MSLDWDFMHVKFYHWIFCFSSVSSEFSYTSSKRQSLEVFLFKNIEEKKTSLQPILVKKWKFDLINIFLKCQKLCGRVLVYFFLPQNTE